MPGNVRTMRSICARGKQLPVGLFGEQSSSSRVSPSVAASSFRSSSEKSGSSGTSRTGTSLIAAATLYMP